MFLQPVYGQLTAVDEEKIGLEKEDELAQTYEENAEDTA